MKVRGDLKPSTFTLEEQPKKPGFYLARFFENAVPYTETRDDTEISGYEYDEYHLELADTGGLHEDIENSYESFFEQAKAEDARIRTEDIPELLQEKADKAEVQAVWDSMAEAYLSGVQQA